MLLMGSCSSPEPEITDKVEHQIEAEDYSVSRADIQTVLSQLTRSNSSCRKMRAKTASKQYTISTIIDQTGQPAIYVVNYAGNGGFVLLSATKKYIPVLAYSQNGNYSITGDLPDGVQQWQSATVSAISANSILPNDSTNNFRDLWDGYIGVDTTGTGSESHEQEFSVDNVFEEKLAEFKNAGYTIHRMTDESITGDAETDEKLRGEAEYVTYPEYDWHKYAVVLEWTEATNLTVDNFMPSTWGQGLPNADPETLCNYNQYCPIVDGKRSFAGCLPVALGQIIYYYKCPSLGYNWDKMLADAPSDESARLLSDIGTSIGVEYGSSSTSGYMSNAINYLKSIFGNDKVKSYTSYSFNTTLSNLQNGYPVLFEGKLTKANGDIKYHSFLGSGVICRTTETKYALYTFGGRYTYSKLYGDLVGNRQSTEYVYINWGNFGIDNGFFYSPNFIKGENGENAYNDAQSIEIKSVTFIGK